MKKNLKRTLIALLCLFTVFCIQTASPLHTVSAHPQRVVDDADILTSQEEMDLTELVNEISERQQFDVVIATVNDLNGNNIDDFAADYYDYGGYGMGDNYDGVLLLISMEEREWFILTTGYAMDVLNDYDLDNLGDEIVPYLSSGDYAGAFETFAKRCDEEIQYANEGGDDGIIYEEEYEYEDEDVMYEDVYKDDGAKPSVVGALVAGLVLGFVPVLIMQGSLKSVRMQNAAANYEKRETRKITLRRDTFLYHTVNRVPRETENHTSSRSGGRSGGSTSFRGSSGRSHGGRGGGF